MIGKSSFSIDLPLLSLVNAETSTFLTEASPVPSLSLVNLSIADQKRASSEALKVRKIVKNRSPQRDFNFEFVTPVKNFITSGYGKKRFINGSPRAPHLALDIDGFEGDPVVAPKSGKVVLAEEHFYSGKFMVVGDGQFYRGFGGYWVFWFLGCQYVFLSMSIWNGFGIS